MNADNTLLNEIIADLQKKYQCHTIILYGSRARKEHTGTSDYDIIAIRNNGAFERDCRIFKNVYLDAFIYPDAILDNSDNCLMRAKDGIVLCQKDHFGDDLLNKLRLMYNEGPPKTPLWEKLEIPAWLNKMLERAKEGGIEGNFRMHWLLHDSLECYFKMRDLWYLGPKESFKWLKENDATTYRAFELALKPNVEFRVIAALIKQVV